MQCLGRVLKRQQAIAFAQWRGEAAEAHRLRECARAVAGIMPRIIVRRHILRWADACRARARLAAAVRALRGGAAMRALHAWRGAAAAATAARTRAVRACAHMAGRHAAKALRAWREWRAYRADLRARLQPALVRWRVVRLAAGFDAFRCVVAGNRNKRAVAERAGRHWASSKMATSFLAWQDYLQVR